MCGLQMFRSFRSPNVTGARRELDGPFVGGLSITCNRSKPKCARLLLKIYQAFRLHREHARHIARRARNSLAIRMADGRKVAVVQIAGLVARRIVCFTRVGQTLRMGDRFGLIRFGSRLDVYLPEGVEPQVALGQIMVAGETVIADLTRALPARLARSE